MNTQKKHIPSMIIAYLFLIVLCIIWVIPLIFSFATSFRSQTEIVSTGFRLLPVNWILDNYIAILTNTLYCAYHAVVMEFTVYRSHSHTVLVVIVVSVTAYGYGRTRFKYRDRIFLSFDGDLDVSRCCEFDSFL